MKGKKKSVKVQKKNPLQKIISVVIIVIAFAIIYFLFTRPTVAPTKTPKTVTETYSGTLPCADCSGLKTGLQLSKTSENATGGTFRMEQTYEGKSTTPFVTSGTWELVHGTQTHMNDSIIELDSGDSQPEFWLMADANTLRMLDSQKNDIQSPFNESLTKEQ